MTDLATLPSAERSTVPPSGAPVHDWEFPWRLRFRTSLRTRAVFVLGTLPFVVADRLGAGFLGTWRGIVALQLTILAVNTGAWVLERHDRVREWHFWTLLTFDFAVIGAVSVAVAPYGYLGLPFLAVAVGRYTLGQPVAGRVGLGLAVTVYAVARVAGLALAGTRAAGTTPAAVIAVELVALATVGLVALWGPQAYTRRVARVRRALAALGGGDLTVRLPTADMDDLRPLAESFNRTAEALAATTQALRDSEARHRAIFDHSAMGILLVDAEGVVRETNAAGQQLLGYSAGELRGFGPDRLAPAEDASTVRDAVRAVASGARARAIVEVRYLHRDGAVGWGALTLSRAPAASGAAVIVMLNDVTERKRLQAELERRASQDPLTGLANRTSLAEHMREALRPGAPLGAAPAEGPTDGSDAQPGGVAVLAVDLDGFKAVNDTYGHAAGDRLLQEVAARLLNATRGSDVVARLGGDEFIVLLRQVAGPEDARVVAERIVAALGAPCALGGGIDRGPGTRRVRVGASVGIAWAPRGVAGDAIDGSAGERTSDDLAAELLRDADRALYQAKALGKGCYVLFGARRAERVA